VQGVESAEIDVRLEMKDRSKEDVLREIREKVSLLPGTNVTVGQPISHRIDHMLSAPGRTSRSRSLVTISRCCEGSPRRCRRRWPACEASFDLSTEMQTEIPTLRVKVDPERASRHGLASGAVAQTLQTARVGRPVGQVIEGQIAVPLVVRYSTQVSSDLDAIGDTVLDTPGGAQIPLSAVADIQRDRGPNFVMRENVQRRIVVQSNVAGRGPSERGQ
jgi:Cu/Ag efflux pump CusA